MALMSKRSWSCWIAEYAKSHRHPVNRLCHTVGIPTIAVAVVMFAAALFVHALWAPAVWLFVVGWMFQLVGHVIEGTPPGVPQGLAVPVRRPALVGGEAPWPGMNLNARQQTGTWSTSPCDTSGSVGPARNDLLDVGLSAAPARRRLSGARARRGDDARWRGGRDGGDDRWLSFRASA